MSNIGRLWERYWRWAMWNWWPWVTGPAAVAVVPLLAAPTKTGPGGVAWFLASFALPIIGAVVLYRWRRRHRPHWRSRIQQDQHDRDEP
jgi:hypothetical protein